jgi:hypothetical protein
MRIILGFYLKRSATVPIGTLLIALLALLAAPVVFASHHSSQHTLAASTAVLYSGSSIAPGKAANEFFILGKNQALPLKVAHKMNKKIKPSAPILIKKLVLKSRQQQGPHLSHKKMRHQLASRDLAHRLHPRLKHGRGSFISHTAAG